MQPSWEMAFCRSSGCTLAGPYLGSDAPVPWPWGLAAVTVPDGFLNDVRTLLTSLAGHDEMDVPFAGLGDKTHASATLRAPPHSTQRLGHTERCVLFYLFHGKKMVSYVFHGSAHLVIWQEHENYFLYP